MAGYDSPRSDDPSTSVAPPSKGKRADVPATPTAKRPRARGRAATENLLRDAALRLLDRDGVLAGISLQDVADEAGLSRGLIHHYFGSRQALLRSALEARRQEAAAQFQHRRHRSPAARFKWFWRGTIRDPHWATIMALLAIDGDESFEPIHLADEVLADLRDEIDAGEYGPGMDAEASHALTLALACGWSLLRQSFARQLGVPVEQLDARVEALVLRMGESLQALEDPWDSS